MPDDFDVSSIIDQAKDNIGKGPFNLGRGTVFPPIPFFTRKTFRSDFFFGRVKSTICIQIFVKFLLTSPGSDIFFLSFRLKFLL
jgi:hypothetical protein